jgi:Icc-related predicted phosphoesterase
MDIIVTGDIHGKFGYLNRLINKYQKQLDLVICCGDFGYWPNFDNGHTKIKTPVPILWCDGNHEDHWAIRELIKTNNLEIAKNVFYMPRGSTYTLKDGRTILFMGGADSIDKGQRRIGHDWFPEEVITQRDMINLPDIKVDIFITHTCPVEIYPVLAKFYYGKELEPSNHALSDLWKIYKPNLWFFGHWHYYKEGNLGDTKWHALGDAGSGGKWWTWLPSNILG